MTLIERWQNFKMGRILTEMQQILKHYSDWQSLFCVDENGNPIRYCADNSQDESLETYGRKIAGICFSEEVAQDAVKTVLMEYTFLLVPWFFNDSQTVDLCIEMPFPVGYEHDEYGTELFFTDVIFKFEKCENRGGFCVSKIIPVK